MTCLLWILAMALITHMLYDESSFSSHTHHSDEEPLREIKYQLLNPREGGKSKYPLIVFLHGAGERGADNTKQLLYLPQLMAEEAHQRRFPCFLLAPQCPAGYQWVDVPWSDPRSTPMKDNPTCPLRYTMDILNNIVARYPIDRRRIYLAGISMGGFGSWELASRRPEWFAAVVPCCGGGDEQQAHRLVSVPVWAFHGKQDDVVPVARSQQMIHAIRTAGGHPLYTEYPDMGHDVWTMAYDERTGLLEWMFQQAKSV